jgi:hypothetical protein
MPYQSYKDMRKLGLEHMQTYSNQYKEGEDNGTTTI